MAATPNSASAKSFVPWRQEEPVDSGQLSGNPPSFEARYKRLPLMLMIAFFLGLIWLGASLLGKDLSEMFVVTAVTALGTLSLKWFERFFTLALIIIVLATVGLAMTDLGPILGTITTVIIFFGLIPFAVIAMLPLLFDKRPQLVIGPNGVTCRQYGEAEIPWEHIGRVYVSTYRQYRWMPEQKTLLISLKDPSFYPASDGARVLRKQIDRLGRLLHRSAGRTDIQIGGWLLDPELPFIMKAIKRYRPERKPKVGQRRKKSSRLRKQSKG